jgi:hypothetical protein
MCGAPKSQTITQKTELDPNLQRLLYGGIFPGAPAAQPAAPAAPMSDNGGGGSDDRDSNDMLSAALGLLPRAVCAPYFPAVVNTVIRRPLNQAAATCLIVRKAPTEPAVRVLNLAASELRQMQAGSRELSEWPWAALSCRRWASPRSTKVRCP